MKARTLVVMVSMLALALAACGGTDDGQLIPVFETKTQGIFYGNPPNAPEHDAVVALATVKNGYASFFCSGTMIRPNVVLSAAHCLKGQRANKVIAIVGDNWIDGINAGTYYWGASLKVHPLYNSRTNVNDIAMLKLAVNVPGVTPVPEAPANVGLTVGERLNFAGFGQTEDGTVGTKMQVDSNLDGFGCDADCGCGRDSGDVNSMICYDQQDNGPCFGDSGGPAFVYRGGSAYVGGMTSYGDSACTVYGVSSRADTAEAFIHGFAGAN